MGTKEDHDKLSKWINTIRLSFITLSLLLTYVLQFGMLAWCYTTAVLPAVRAAQELYKEYHSECFESDGSFSSAKWEDWNEVKRDNLCGLVLSSFWSLYLLLTAWWLIVLSEFRRVENLFTLVVHVPRARSYDGQVEHVDAEDHFHVVRAMELEVKIFLILVVILPKFVVVVLFFALGTWWLAAAKGVSDLLLIAVSLSLISNFDKIIFVALFPTRLHLEIRETKIWKATGDMERYLQREHWQSYLWCLIYWVVIAVGPLLYLTFLQDQPWLGVVPGFAGDVSQCESYWAESSTLLCNGWAVWKGAWCFPYGSADTQLPPHPEVYGTG